MKMKCKFFGATAKLAMAILAVGAMFTSCYDSENGDVTKPYKAPDAVYTFVVTVTNGITGNPVTDADVTVGAASCDKVGNGVYQKVVTNDQTGTKMASTVTVSVAGRANEYDAASTTVEVADITNGQAITCYANIVVNPTVFIPEGMKVEVSTNTTSDTDSYTGDKVYGEQENITIDSSLDIINRTEEPMLISRDITYPTGIMYLKPVAATRAIDVLAGIHDYITKAEGVDNIADKFTEKETKKYSFLLPAASALQKISIQYIYDDKTYAVAYDGQSYTATTRRLVSVIFSNTPVLLNMYHGHGHGHGHGGDLNAGGGIFE
ncbi:DUF3869 domain-containing protein [uncultured Bacteroides sp.]|uniref:DUF3869 domain-containing protein n=2 Tax=uncultured Bacteroides sp. TaxID=162156 RepID=UPI00262DAEAE|nr:DUF3869 domain-containing protein [uncultured Bacteroides sp.]